MRCLLLIAALTLFGEVARAEEPAKPAKSLRRPRPAAPEEIEVVDLTGDRDPQAFALGAAIGGGFLTNIKSGGQGAAHAAISASFGLGERGARVPWTLEPWLAFAITYGVLFEKGGHPNRFTEIGTRLVYRGESGLFANRWASFGVGLVWSSRRPSSGFLSPGRECFNDPDKAASIGLDCSRTTGISPGFLVDLGVGVHEWTVRRARWGIGLRAPLQLSSTPGFALLGVFYGQVGTAL